MNARDAALAARSAEARARNPHYVAGLPTPAETRALLEAHAFAVHALLQADAQTTAADAEGTWDQAAPKPEGPYDLVELCAPTSIFRGTTDGQPFGVMVLQDGTWLSLGRSAGFAQAMGTVFGGGAPAVAANLRVLPAERAVVVLQRDGLAFAVARQVDGRWVVLPRAVAYADAARGGSVPSRADRRRALRARVPPRRR